MPSYADSTSRNRIECLQSCDNNEKCTPTGGINTANLDRSIKNKEETPGSSDLAVDKMIALCGGDPSAIALVKLGQSSANGVIDSIAAHACFSTAGFRTIDTSTKCSKFETPIEYILKEDLYDDAGIRDECLDSDGEVITSCLESDGKIKYAAVSYPHTSEWVVPNKLTLTPQDCSKKARYVSDNPDVSDVLCECKSFALDILVDGDSDNLGPGDTKTTIRYQSSDPIGTVEYTQSDKYQAPIKTITTNNCTLKIDCYDDKNDCAGRGVPSGDA
jgi:hypothetical protein